MTAASPEGRGGRKIVFAKVLYAPRYFRNAYMQQYTTTSPMQYTTCDRLPETGRSGCSSIKSVLRSTGNTSVVPSNRRGSRMAPTLAHRQLQNSQKPGLSIENASPSFFPPTRLKALKAKNARKSCGNKMPIPPNPNASAQPNSEETAIP